MIASVFRRLLKRGHSATAAVRRSPVRLAFEALEDRLTPTTLTVGAGEPYTTIMSAVNAAKANYTIVVEPGTYTEQVIIPATLNGLTLTAASGYVQGGQCDDDRQSNGNVTIQAPATFPVDANGTPLTFDEVVDVTGAQNVTINGFNINGNTSTQYGIRVEGGASVNITANNVTNILGSNGAGIDVGDASHMQIGSGIVAGNNVSSYTKVGIVVDNTGSTAAVAYNNVTGLGLTLTNGIPQYGIQVSDGANAEVAGNFVTANSNVADSAAGILLFSTGNHTSIEGNFTTGNEYGILIFNSNNVLTDFNTSYQNNNDGIQLQGTSNNLVTNNISAFNGGDGISVYNSDTQAAVNNTISGNTIVGNAGNGVTVDDASGTQVVGNLIVANGTAGSGSANGVSITDSTGGTVAFNFIVQTDGTYAINVSSSNPNVHANLVVEF